MARIDFHEAVTRIVATDPRYEPEAYAFLRDSLDFTVKEGRRGSTGSPESRHVSGAELVQGFRKLALRDFGPASGMVLRTWGVRSCEDIGEMVFNLIDAHVFGKNDSDSREDFAGHYSFEAVFEQPFQARPSEGVDSSHS